MPLEEALIPLVDELTGSAEAIKIVDTIVDAAARDRLRRRLEASPR